MIGTYSTSLIPIDARPVEKASRKPDDSEEKGTAGEMKREEAKGGWMDPQPICHQAEFVFFLQ
jgi:hypothetical protein